MADTELPPEESPEPDPSAWDEEIAPIETPLDKRRLDWWIEVGVVICLAWLPPFAYALLSEAVWFSPDEWRTDILVDDRAFFWESLDLVVLSMQVLIPLLWIIWRSDISWSEMGVVRIRWLRDLILGVLLAAAVFAFDLVFVLVLKPHWYPMETMPSGVAGIALLGPVMLLNSFAEEFVWRGFLLQRFRQLFGSGAVALVISSALFASYHIYQGAAALIPIFIGGLIWGASVLALRSIWPAIVAHTVFNIYAMLPFAWWPGE